MTHELSVREELESTVLGQLLLDFPACQEAFQLLKPEHFKTPALRAVFEAIQDLGVRLGQADVILVGDALRAKHGAGQEVLSGLLGMVELCPSVANVMFYTKLLLTLPDPEEKEPRKRKRAQSEDLPQKEEL